MQLNVDVVIPVIITFNTSTISNALMAGGLRFKGILATYPSHTPRAMPMTPAQRRGFFARLRSGAIQVPYRRGQSPGSQALGRRWAVSRNGNMSVTVGNNATYAALVQGGSQTGYHRVTGWKTAQQAWDDNAQTIVRDIREAVGRGLNNG